MIIILRKATREDIDDIDEIRGRRLPLLQEERFSEQDSEKSLYLLAFLDKIPIGYVYINLDGSEKHHSLPNLQDLYVKKDSRRKGFAYDILKRAEDFIKELGYPGVGLDVEVNKIWIKDLYEKCGFSIKGGIRNISWVEKDSRERMELRVYYMEKRL